MFKLTAVFAMLFIITGCFKSGPKGGSSVFYLNMQGESNNINPITSTDAYSSELQGYILESLLEKNLDTYEWEPGLAESWDISKDKMKFTFKIRAGAKWSDGKPVTAEDVKFSFDVIFDPAYNTAHKRPYYEGLKEVKVIDERTVEVIAKDQYFQNFDIAAGALTILPKHFYSNKANEDQFTKVMIGSGPYLLDKYLKGKQFTLKKNPTWWGLNVEKNKSTWLIPTIVLKFVQDPNVSLEMLKKGDIDFMGFTPEIYVKKTEGEMWGRDVFKVKTTNQSPKGYSFIGWNFKHPILKDRQVRKALYHLVNRPLMIEKFEYGLSTQATGPVYPGSVYADPSIKPVEFNPELALKTLREAGWKDTDGDNILDKVIDGVKTKLSITILEPYEPFVKYLTVFKEDAKKAGVEINIKLMEWNSFLKLLEERKFDALRLAWTANIDWDPKQIWHSSSINGGSNFISFSNKKTDELIDKARYIYDRDQRAKVLHQVLRTIVDEYPYVFMTYKPDTFYGHTKKIVKPKDTFIFGIGEKHWTLKAD
jgi:peptide/nickel transport system substrate-binding protein/microcin C transport system substrate-binding protein